MKTDRKNKKINDIKTNGETRELNRRMNDGERDSKMADGTNNVRQNDCETEPTKDTKEPQNANIKNKQNDVFREERKY